MLGQTQLTSQCELENLIVCETSVDILKIKFLSAITAHVSLASLD